MAGKNRENDVLGYSSDGEEDKGDSSGLSLEKVSLGPRKKLLVLDLAGVLCDRIFRGNEAKIPKNRVPDATGGNFFVYKRNYCEEFLRFCFERFQVGIWSSAKKWNLDFAMDCVLGRLRGKLLFTWDQDHCTDSGFTTLEIKNKPIFFKELRKLWENNDLDLPWRAGEYSASNTLLIDDKPYKALMNPPNTAIFPVEYDSVDVNDNALSPKSELWCFLDGLAEAEDAPTYVKDHPIGQPAITNTHPHWDLYSKIIATQKEQVLKSEE